MIINKAKKLFFYLKKTYFTLRNMDPFDPSPIRPKVDACAPKFLIPGSSISLTTINPKAFINMPFLSKREKIIITLLGAGLLLTLGIVRDKKNN